MQQHAELSYRPDIDGLRGIAVLSVLGFHAFPSLVKGGFVGVDVFFVISGYLISGIIIADAARGRFSFLGFYGRRIRRIFPALIVVLLFCMVYGWLFLLPHDYAELGVNAAGGAGFISNFVLLAQSGYFGRRPIPGPCCIYGRWESKSNITCAGLCYCGSSLGARVR